MSVPSQTRLLFSLTSTRASFKSRSVLHSQIRKLHIACLQLEHLVISRSLWRTRIVLFCLFSSVIAGENLRLALPFSGSTLPYRILIKFNEMVLWKLDYRAVIFWRVLILKIEHAELSYERDFNEGTRKNRF